jgi:molybdate transport system substrate-binding protein
VKTFSSISLINKEGAPSETREVGLTPLVARTQELTVFAAASLTDAMKDVSAQWSQAGHQPLRMPSGSSSTLARQIVEAAPVKVFASADQKWIDYLAEKNLIVPDTRKDLLGNDLVLVVPADKPRHVTIDPGFDLLGLLGPNGRVATGDLAHVPVGIYAEQVLKKLRI